MKAILLVLALMAIVGCSKSPNPTQSSMAQKNFQETPPSGFTGAWTVYATTSGKKRIEVYYKDGQKAGTEMRWYPNSGFKMSLHNYVDGNLEGKYTKWRDDGNGTILVEGEFKSGKPWNGFFLEGWDRQVDLSLDVVDRDVPYLVLEYKDGNVVRRFEKP